MPSGPLICAHCGEPLNAKDGQHATVHAVVRLLHRELGEPPLTPSTRQGRRVTPSRGENVDRGRLVAKLRELLEPYRGENFPDFGGGYRTAIEEVIEWVDESDSSAYWCRRCRCGLDAPVCPTCEREADIR